VLLKLALLNLETINLAFVQTGTAKPKSIQHVLA
jgi:hypothetical protein